MNATTVNYYLQGTTTKVIASKVVPNQTYGTVIYSANEIIDVDGYRYMGYQSETMTIGETSSYNQINLYYAKLSSITIKYVDINTGNEISDRVNHTDTVGSEFNIASDRKNIPGYVLVQEPANKKGTYSTSTKTFTYYYSRQSIVVVKYVDKYSGEEIDAREIKYGYTGKTYTTDEKSIEGYTFVENSGNTTGTMQGDVVEVFYYYAKNSSVTIRYLDKISGEPLDNNIVIPGYEGKEYSSSSKTIPGYTYLESTGLVSGVMAREPSYVNYYYAENTSVTVNYINKYTNERISDSTTIEGYEGKPYITTRKEISGYTYLESSDNVNGTMQKGGTVVNYYYGKEATVNVRYLDRADNSPIADPTEITGYVGQDYLARPLQVSEYSYSNSSNNEEGVMTETPINVIFYYNKSTGITVKYVDVNSNVEISEEKHYQDYSSNQYDVTSDKKKRK